MVLFVWHPPMVIPMAEWCDRPTNVCDVACNLLMTWASTSLGTRVEEEDVFTV